LIKTFDPFEGQNPITIDMASQAAHYIPHPDLPPRVGKEFLLGSKLELYK
jgi:hypothetical protein